MRILVFYFFIFSFVCYAQDSARVQEDSTYFGYNDHEDSHAVADSMNVQARSFDHETVSTLKSDESLQYEELPTIAESLWDRLLLLLQQFFDSLFRNAIGTDWGRVLSYALGIAIVVVLIMMVLKVNAFKIFYAGEGASTMPHHVFDENIHEMDFEKLIQEALEQKDYRKGIRLIFLNSLKMLADKKLIMWEQGKTNHDYLTELNQHDFKEGFSELNYYFEYAWYGNFSISHSLFLKVQDVFKEWKLQVR